MRSALF